MIIDNDVVILVILQSKLVLHGVLSFICTSVADEEMSDIYLI